jgi:hypothetical protein
MSFKNNHWSSSFLLALIGIGNISFLAHEANALSVTSDFDRNTTVIPTTINARTGLNNFIANNGSNTIDFGTTSADVTLSGNDATAYTFSKNGVSFSTNANAGAILGVNDSLARGFNTTGSGSSYTDTSGFRLQLAPTNNDTLTLTFAVPVTKFGLIFTDYGNANLGDGFVAFVFRDSFNNIIPNSIAPFTNLNGGSTGTAPRNALFLGFSTTGSDPAIGSATITIRNSSADTFSLDDIRTEPVPFEFEASTGLLVVAGYFVGKRYLKNPKA